MISIIQFLTLLLSLFIIAWIIFYSLSKSKREKIVNILFLPLFFYLLNWGVNYILKFGSIIGCFYVFGATLIVLFIFNKKLFSFSTKLKE